MKKYVFTMPDGVKHAIEAFSATQARGMLICHFKELIHHIVFSEPVELRSPDRNYVYLGYDIHNSLCGKFTQTGESRDHALLLIQRMLLGMGIYNVVRFELKECYKTDQSIVEYAPGCYSRI